jgi:ribosomal protein L16 Arg81 hydroxylase
MVYSNELQYILSPIQVEEFQKKYFEKEPLLISRNDKSFFESLLSIHTINQYLERKDIRYPSIRLIKDGLELPQTDYLKNLPFGNQVFDRIIDNDRLFTLFAEGNTVVFQALHRTFPALSHFCLNIEKLFKFPVQTNIYLTPGGSQGFSPHFDNHDVFVLQTYGSKIWKIYDSPVYLPTKPFDKKKWIPTQAKIEIELEEGDTLYIPRGFIHEALTTDQASMHITLGLLTYTWIDVFRLLLDKTHSYSQFRTSFNSYNLSKDQFDSYLKELFDLLSNTVNFNEIKEEVHLRFARKSLSSDTNRLLDILNLNNIQSNTKFKFRKEITYDIKMDKEHVILSFYDKVLTFPSYSNIILDQILSSESFSISILDGDFAENEKIVLVKKLLKEGLITMIQ